MREPALVTEARRPLGRRSVLVRRRDSRVGSGEDEFASHTRVPWVLDRSRRLAEAARWGNASVVSFAAPKKANKIALTSSTLSGVAFRQELLLEHSLLHTVLLSHCTTTAAAAAQGSAAALNLITDPKFPSQPPTQTKNKSVQDLRGASITRTAPNDSAAPQRLACVRSKKSLPIGIEPMTYRLTVCRSAS